MSKSECVVCGVVIDAAPTGRKSKFCPPCKKEQRRKYQHDYHLRRPRRAVAKVRQTNAKAAYELLKQYERSAAFKQTGSYNEPLPGSTPFLQVKRVDYGSSSVRYAKDSQLYLELKKYVERRRSGKKES